MIGLRIDFRDHAALLSWVQRAQAGPSIPQGVAVYHSGEADTFVIRRRGDRADAEELTPDQIPEGPDLLQSLVIGKADGPAALQAAADIEAAKRTAAPSGKKAANRAARVKAGQDLAAQRLADAEKDGAKGDGA